ncbi:heme exporter protein CcmD [Polymorphum gilvum]|uniref:Heme exporter protein D n=1 Tax=Polymorphum gilvum (strain LMG 25793 / CGMCC 1.9160 / SL003B-26A1) TaxID=991905 RepID=F2J141_POLGS|nr:heme exporter protein CcmD [Polymorphum gilvum]ADZ68687.1 Heme exporter protein CcmD [Polymorphum gilvum SL003B-26A1]
MDLGPHAGFIIASYATCAAVVAGLIVWVFADKARQEAALADLEAQGIGRRAGAGKGGTHEA